MFYKFIKETDTEIHLSTVGMEIPNAECVNVEFSEEGPTYNIITFESGKKILCYLFISMFFAKDHRHTYYIFHKKYTGKDAKKCKNTYNTLSTDYITTTTQS